MSRVMMMISPSWLQKARTNGSLTNISRRYVAYLLLPVVLGISIFGQSKCLAAESNSVPVIHGNGYAGVYKYKFNSSFSLRGWRLSQNVYFGQTKAFGTTRYGLLIDKGDYAYGLMNQQISILKNF